ncbi:unnamed protein product [Microthlaspi erraticum]|uniref:Uncharacterized protein n=1 Tax=Microthlaspi erraticum TaxID=1685480 RepID=A0A6D2KHX2_9BRAS|nr:unnamed protein product [Microthlaspi erraticum]CAA7047805.1 unnamed protein product [Microthlaspi erraticum]
MYVSLVHENEESYDDEHGDPEDVHISTRMWTVPEWDVDSFDGYKYHSAEPDELNGAATNARSWGARGFTWSQGLGLCIA